MSSPLFPRQAKSMFLKVTADRYRAMRRRLQRKSMTLPFDLNRFRWHLLKQIGDEFGGVFSCRYCNRWLGIEEAAADHEVPLMRGGSPYIENIRLICSQCNNRKGGLLPDEYLSLLDFLEREIPLGRTDILKRLGMANKLAAGAANRNKKEKEKGDSDGDVRRMGTT